MIQVNYSGRVYECARAVRGVNYVRLYDASNIQLAAFEEVSDLSGFTISGGEWERGKSTQRVTATARRELDAFVLTINEKAIAEDGLFISFVAPTDSKNVSAVTINGTSYSFVDAVNESIGDVANCFVAGAAIEIILSEIDGMRRAYLQNGATNAYLENTFQHKTKTLRAADTMNVEDRVPFYSEKNDHDRSITVKKLREILGVTTATISVTACEGSEVVCTNGKETMSGIGSTKFASLPVGVWTVTATLNGKTATEQVEIVDNIQYNVDLRLTASIAITSLPNKRAYFANETFDASGMVVTATFEDGTTDDVTEDCTVSPQTLAQGTTKVVVSYSKAGVTVTANVAVAVRRLTAIAITAAPIKTNYLWNESFDPTGMGVTAIYNDGATRAVTGWTYSPTDGLSGGTIQIDVEYTENGVTATTSQPITVMIYVHSIEVQTPPTKTTYLINDTFDPSGMVIVGYAIDGSVRLIEDYIVTPSALTAQTTEVMISHRNELGEYCQCSQPVEVKFVSRVLNDNSWEVIRLVSDAGQAANYWSVGDRKSITFTDEGLAGAYAGLTVDAFILGFDHNADIEGHNKIHFSIGKIGDNDPGKGLVGDTALVTVDNGPDFYMDADGVAATPWVHTYMRNTLLGNQTPVDSTTLTDPLNPTANSFLAMMPLDLRAVMKHVRKYTFTNGWGAQPGSSVGCASECLFLLAEYEIFGTCEVAYDEEMNYQQQYAYYAAGNSAKRRPHNLDHITGGWWCRSRADNANLWYCYVTSGGAINVNFPHHVQGVAPCFCV